MKRFILAAVLVAVAVTTSQGCWRPGAVRQAIAERRAERHTQSVQYTTACQFSQASSSPPVVAASPVMQANYPTPVRNVVVPVVHSVGSLVLPSRGGVTCANGVCTPTVVGR